MTKAKLDKALLHIFVDSEDAIQPLAVEMYMVTCLLHAVMLFSRTIYDTHSKTGQNRFKPIWKSTMSAVQAQYQLFGHNINIYGFARDVPLTNQSLDVNNEKVF